MPARRPATTAPPTDQLDLFAHSQGTVLRNDAVDALHRRDVHAARAARQALAGATPPQHGLAALDSLIAALHTTDTSPLAGPAAAASARMHLADVLTPAAQAWLGPGAAAAWLAPLWRGLAERAAALPFDAAHPDDHAAPLWLRAGDAHRAADATARVASWRRMPTTLDWMLQARHRSDGLDAVWPLLAELAWLAAPRLAHTARTLADPLLDRLLRRFDERFDPGPDSSTPVLAWFPAWLLTEQAALLPLLRPASTGQDTAPERCFRLLVDLLGLERQGRHQEVVAGRKRLRDQQPALYAAYMATR